MPKYKLTYFNARGLGEIARWVFAQAGQEYQDFRLQQGDWPKYKPDTPFKQVPVLEVDGMKIADSAAIARFLARKFGMAGNGPVEEALVDMYAAAAYDLVKPIDQIYYADEEKKEELKKKFATETAPKFLDGFESAIAGNKSGFLVGDKVTWADFALVHIMGWIWSEFPEEFQTRYQHVKEHSERVEALPNIAAWIAKRPQTTI